MLLAECSRIKPLASYISRFDDGRSTLQAEDEGNSAVLFARYLIFESLHEQRGLWPGCPNKGKRGNGRKRDTLVLVPGEAYFYFQLA